MAELFKMKDMLALARITRHGGLIVTCIATPVIFAFLVFPKWVMGLFGEEFVEAWILLVILSVGQLVNLMTGSVAFLLMMTGHEKLHLFINIIAAVLSVFLSISLIPFFGALGAALSSAIPLILVNLLRTYYVKKKLGFSVFIKSRTLDC
jgi:O-antigen/teichoic acid export membrane protein